MPGLWSYPADIENPGDPALPAMCRKTWSRTHRSARPLPM